ncbi:hypothetical protein [Paenibacillus shirakamiensis]|nr:hypothetical protein [Paenibacillus shirakamiensis]
MIVLVVGMSACSQKTRNIASHENNRYNMKSYKEGVSSSQLEGTGVNVAFLKALKSEFAAEGIPLSGETYADGVGGHISYTYLINGDNAHYIIAHAYPSEAIRIKEMAEMYSNQRGKGNIITSASNAAVLYAKGNTALVYASGSQKNSIYRDKVRSIFERLMGHE